MSRKLPPLNGLIINTKDCVPSNGFNWYQQQYGKTWGEVVCNCWKVFHVSSSREKQVKDFRQRDNDIESLLNE